MMGSGEDRVGLTRGESGKNRDRGQATLEMALVLPLLVLCIAGIVWVGQLMVLQVRIENAAREGARAAAVEPESASSVAQSAARRSVEDAVVATEVGDEFVVVTVTVTSDGVPILGVGRRTLEADVHMRREDIINN